MREQDHFLIFKYWSLGFTMQSSQPEQSGSYEIHIMVIYTQFVYIY